MADPTRFEYILTHEAWYHDPIRRPECWTHEVNIRRGVEGRVDWEFVIQWMDFSDVLRHPTPLAAKVVIFDEAWDAFTELDWLFDQFRRWRSQDVSPTPAQVIELLDGHGFIDVTERERGGIRHG